MAIQVADNFQYLGQKPLDARVKYATVADMAAVAASSLYDGIMAYVVATEKNYQWKSTNPVDQTLGKWREFESGGSDNVVEGYRNPTNGLFYEEAAYTTTITGAANTLYVDLVTVGDAKDIYRWDGTDFVLENTRSQDITYDNYQALSESEKNNGTTYYIPDATAASEMLVVGNRFDKANIYTATERMIGSWMGKPLYQKTFNVNATVNTSSPIIICTEDSINLDEIVDYRGNGLVQSGSSDQRLFSSAMGHVFTNSGNVKYHSAYDNVYVKTITIQYTKTTDGTIKIGTENDYSTDEMIIGSWIDGKPLYQKTYTGLSLTGTESGISTGITILNIDKLVQGFACRTSIDNLAIINSACFKYISNDLKYIDSNGFSDVDTIVIQYTKTTD